MCVCVCVCASINFVFLCCEITTQVIVVTTETWVHCEIDLTMILQISFLVVGLIRVRFIYRVRSRFRIR